MKLTMALLGTLVATAAIGQQLDSTQLKLKANGGLLGDSSHALASTAPRLSTAPASPIAGQVYCDTNTTPCILKQFDGSTWVTILGPAVTTGSTPVTFPSSPTTGQLYYTQTPPYLWIYDAAVSGWRSIPVLSSKTNSAISDENCTGTPMSDPADAPTVTTVTTGGSIAAGAYSYKYTYVNSTGGETLPSPQSTSITTTGSTSTNTVTVTEGPNGTVARRIYRSKVNAAASGPWYFTGWIDDNTTGTYDDTTADAANVLLVPSSNYSGALPSGWSVINNGTGNGAITGGAGCTERGTFGVAQAQTVQNIITSYATDSNLILLRDISAFSAGSFSITYRVTAIGATYNLYNASCCLGLGGVRESTDANSEYYAGAMFAYNTAWTPPMTTSLFLDGGDHYRSTTGGGNAAMSATSGGCLPNPPIYQFPFWARVVYRTSNPPNGVTGGISSDGTGGFGWGTGCPIATGQSNLNQWATYYRIIAATWHYFQIAPQRSDVSYSSYIEFDSFSLTAN